jgi:hypothetical protein
VHQEYFTARDVFQNPVSMALTHLFSYDSRTTLSGAVAQLGERLNGIQEVESSILFGSTRKSKGVSACWDPFFVGIFLTQKKKSLSFAMPR